MQAHRAGARCALFSTHVEDGRVCWSSQRPVKAFVGRTCPDGVDNAW